MKFFLLLFFLVPLTLQAQRITYTLEGNFRLLQQCRKIYLAFSDEQRVDSIDFPSNGRLRISGSLAKPGPVNLRLDSLGAIRLWLDEGHISFVCEEKLQPGYKNRLEITQLDGPPDTRLLHLLRPDGAEYRFPPGTPRAKMDSIVKAHAYNKAYNLIDSLIRVRPASGVIPYYITYYNPSLGREAVSEFYYRLPASSQNSNQGKTVLQYLQRSNLLQKGTTLEDFSMPAHDGSVFQLSAHNEKYTLLNFWASWCGPCREEHPHLVNIFKRFNQQGFTIVSVSLDENRNNWLVAIKKDNLQWTNISDLMGRQNALARRYKISPIPFNVLLDSNKRVIAAGIRPGILEKFLEENLKH